MFVADDDPECANAFLEEVVGLNEWLAERRACSGMSVLVVDSTLWDGSHSIGTPWRAWCDQHGIAHDPPDKVLIVLSAGKGRTEGSAHRWYVKGPQLRADLEAIRDMLLRTRAGALALDDWPQHLIAPVDVLSMTIHALYNCIVPLKVDMQTLSDAPVADESMGAEIWQQYFADVTGYLRKGKLFGEDSAARPAARGLEEFIAQQLRQLYGSLCAAGLAAQEGSTDAEDAARNVICQVAAASSDADAAAVLAARLDLVAIRARNAVLSAMDSKSLRQDLCLLVTCVEGLITVLKGARDLRIASLGLKG